MPFVTASFQVPATINDDLMIITVLDHLLVDSPIQYVIEDAAARVCRKGSFKGCRIQMRIADLKDGAYQLLLKNAEGCCSFSIEKVSSKWMTVSGEDW